MLSGAATKDMDHDNDTTIGTIRRNIDDEHFASGMPDQHFSFTDKLDSHKSGDLFKYAVITNAPSEERKSMLSKLRSFKAQSRVENLTLSDIKPIRLVGDAVNFPLKQVIDQKMFHDSADFMLIDCVLVHFIPLDSFANDKSIVTVQVNDFRKTDNTVARVARIDNTMGYNVLFSLDYCVEKSDADKISLSFTCPSKNFQEGISWGTVKVVAQLQFLSFPRRVPLIETIGVAILSDTDLDEFICDPRELDLVLSPQALKGLRQAKKRGEIENLTIPKTDARELTTARTVLGNMIENDDVGSVVGNMKSMARSMKSREEHTKPHSQIPSKPMSSILKRESTAAIVGTSDLASDAGAYENLKDVDPDESASMSLSDRNRFDSYQEEGLGDRVVRFNG